MAKIVTPLTNTEVKQAKAKDKVYKLSDGEGLQLRIKPNGTKTWLLDYFKPYTKKRTSISLGSYPSVTLAEARQKKREARELLAKEIDPKTHRDEATELAKEELQNTFGKVAEKWLVLKQQQVKAETASHAWRNLERHVLPDLENVPIHLVKPKMVIDILNPIAHKGSLETVKRLCRNINEIMRQGVASGLIEVNYLADITKLFAAPKKTNMPTITPERLPELMKALSVASIMRNTRSLIEWQLHTMTRPIEAVTAKWSDINFEEKVGVIPAERMKMNKPHVIPLTPQALSLLEFIKSTSGHREYLFPSHRDPKSHANSQTANMALKRMGFNGQLVSHGLRALASTTLNEQGFDPDVIESALAHVDKNEVRRAYNRAEYLERRRILMCWWSNHIEQCSKGDMSIASNVSVQGLKLVNI
jgi:integrase